VSACSWPQLQWPGFPPRSWAAFCRARTRWRSRDAANAQLGRFPKVPGVTATPLPTQGAIAPMVVIVTPAASISFFRPELDDFLQAPIGMERNEMPLSVLSALARLNLDPWKEAAELSELPRDSAAQRLAALIVRLPGGQWTQADSMGIAHRLIELLPRRSSPAVPLIEKVHGIPRITSSPSARMLICAALVGIAIISVASCEPASGATAPQVDGALGRRGEDGVRLSKAAELVASAPWVAKCTIRCWARPPRSDRSFTTASVAHRLGTFRI
jgi:hypothetical protein